MILCGLKVFTSWTKQLVVKYLVQIVSKRLRLNFVCQTFSKCMGLNGQTFAAFTDLDIASLWLSMCRPVDTILTVVYSYFSRVDIFVAIPMGNDTSDYMTNPHIYLYPAGTTD